MGLSFHYSGNIVKPELLPELIDEVKEIVKVFGWKYTTFDQEFPEVSFLKTEYSDKIFGICFTPPECETVFISFLSNGRMSSPTHLEFYGKTPTQPERKYLYMLSVKTQFAGVAIHQILIQLFRHLNKKYFSGFKMMDEGYYWETNDEELSKTTFHKYNALLGNFVFAAENFPAQKGETLENYLVRLFQMVKKKFDEI
jgi:hypothetical protein